MVEKKFLIPFLLSGSADGDVSQIAATHDLRRTACRISQEGPAVIPDVRGFAGRVRYFARMRDDEDEPMEPWSADEIMPSARRFGYPTAGEESADSYTAIRMMKSDYHVVTKEGVTVAVVQNWAEIIAQKPDPS